MPQIEVFADVGCPFAHVSLRMIDERRRATGRDDVTIRVRCWPLEVINGKPFDPDHIAEEVEALRRVVPHLFTGFRVDTYPATTLPAMALGAIADRHDPTLGERVNLEVRDLLFEQGVDVADLGVLVDLGARHGLEVSEADLDDLAAIEVDHHEGEQRGVQGSPHIFTPAADAFCPALSVSRDEQGRFNVEDARHRFDELIAPVLG